VAERAYCICRPADGRLYVETPTTDSLRNLLITQRFRRDAHFRTRQGYVPYSGGGLAFSARYLTLKGVKPVWYLREKGNYKRALRQLVRDGIYADVHEAESFHDVHPSECEWRGPKGMRFDPAQVKFAWAKKRTLIRPWLPPKVPIGTSTPRSGNSPCRRR
jgi:hypothetical protein